jgi:hypothetical protein
MPVGICGECNGNTTKITSVKEMRNKIDFFHNLKRKIETGCDFVIFAERGRDQRVSGDV